jgi:hypothetical protein
MQSLEGCTGWKKKYLLLPFLLLPLLPIIPLLGDFIYQQGSLYSDLAISHYPNAVFLRNSLLNFHIPFWSPTILSGYPFIADPLSGIWYLPGWIALLFSLPFGINMVVLLHLLFGGAGMFFLLDSQRLSPWAAVFGAVLFEISPKIIAHFAAGHITLIYAICWTPWLLFYDQKARKGTPGFIEKIIPGIILGMIILADIRWAAFAGLLWMGFSLFTREYPPVNRRDEAKTGRFYRLCMQSSALIHGLKISSIILQVLAAILISSSLLIPLLQFTSLSTRTDLTNEESSIYALPPAKLLGLIFPDIGGSAEWILYPGALTTVLFLLLLSSSNLRKSCRFWIISALIALLYALGSNTFLFTILNELPGVSLLRVPSRALFVFEICLCVIAAYSLDGLLSSKAILVEYKKVKPDLILFGTCIFTLLLVIGIYMITGIKTVNYLWGGAAIILASLLIILWLHQKISRNYFLIGVFLLCLVDLGGVYSLSIQPRTVQRVLSEGEEAAEYLSGQSGLFRVYSPSYSISQQTAVQYGIQLADGIDPLQLSAYVSFMETATGVISNGYHVTVPAFATGNPKTDNLAAIPDAKTLGLLNIRFVVSEFDQTAAGLNLVKRFGETRIYENEYWLPRAWVQDPSNPIGDDFWQVEALNWQPDQIEIDATGPGLLVVSEINYPGWKVWVDGRLAEIETTNGLFRSVQIEEGQHHIVFTFHPWWIYLGAGIAGSTWAIFIFFFFIEKHKGRRCLK